MGLEAYICNCGAITVEKGREFISLPRDAFDKNFPDLLIENEDSPWGNCNYCVNNWGINLCACGSGELFDECEEGFPECGKPYQNLEAFLWDT